MPVSNIRENPPPARSEGPEGVAVNPLKKNSGSNGLIFSVTFVVMLELTDNAVFSSSNNLRSLNPFTDANSAKCL